MLTDARIITSNMIYNYLIKILVTAPEKLGEALW
jgi:hypothetical protein